MGKTGYVGLCGWDIQGTNKVVVSRHNSSSEMFETELFRYGSVVGRADSVPSGVLTVPSVGAVTCACSRALLRTRGLAF